MSVKFKLENLFFTVENPGDNFSKLGYNLDIFLKRRGLSFDRKALNTCVLYLV